MTMFCTNSCAAFSKCISADALVYFWMSSVIKWRKCWLLVPHVLIIYSIIHLRLTASRGLC
ncbi:hypothetical protein BDV26DRAFT_269659 [Aspergillus bertholletiae]|uniref:Uncharacterized protein n=1 Tax=Aspergillus bertholletiae TaxID=1226010 RepID=A0A5N7AXX0_9EURO|nr:hypothetical protein BDV26DRAFT_269659 [Aspergillus bertholletiae]